MALMFKGPAALTGASTIGGSTAISTTGNIATTSSGTLTVAGTSTLTGAVSTTAGVTVGNTLTVSAGGATITGNSSFAGSSTLSVGGLLTASAGIQIAGNQLTSIDPGTGGGGDNLIIASKLSVTQAIAAAGGGGGDTIVNATTMTSNAYDAFDIGASNVIYFANTANSGSTALTATLNQGSSPAPTNGQRLFVCWSAKGGTQPSLAVSFASNKIYDAAGTEASTLTFSNVGGSALFYYSTAGTGHWNLAYAGAALS